MERDRWRRGITVALVANLVLTVTALGVGIATLRQAPASDSSAVSGPVTTIVVPTTGATLSGTAPLLAKPVGSGAVAVEFLATGGGSLHGDKIGAGALTLVGWGTSWDSRHVANGTYSLVSVAFDAQGHSRQSTPVVVNVSN